MSKTLVAYFSVSNTTKAVAEKIAEEEKADIFAIVPEKPYTKEDLNWKDKQARSTVEMADPNCHPAMAEKTPDLSAYKTVILGFPIWWGREPSIVDTFLTSADFAGKIIIPFCTSGGSGMGRTCERIQNIVGKDAKVMEGRRVGGEVSMEDLKLWFDGFQEWN
ncbi:flavodoxin [Bilifractor sp. LCP19S3_H10]|uniref:flavodoxin n=1 Tax=unclassified Bilifractor TaxID=2815795 RepID=UPI003F8BDE8A|nr:flavodoxin [Eubacterium sp.]